MPPLRQKNLIFRFGQQSPNDHSLLTPNVLANTAISLTAEASKKTDDFFTFNFDLKGL
jgi:hypothetical protein